MLQVILGGLLPLPARQMNPTKALFPVVFVHGLGGWGEGAPLDSLLSDWGAMDSLVEKGYECYIADVGAISSAWDRACELYAHLTGTRVDYGAAHAAQNNHARFGKDYRRPLVPGWGPERKLHLIGHSFGGPTIRLFAQLCEEGSAAERAATSKDKLSPLFSGELKGRIASITTLASPHNGSSATESVIMAETSIDKLITAFRVLAVAGEVVPLVGAALPLQLDQFGISFWGFWTTPWKAVKNYKNLNDGHDVSLTDLTVDGAAALNNTIRCLPGIYYFSYAGKLTEDDGQGNQMPKDGMYSILQSPATAMGRKREPFKTAGGILIDAKWAASDGIVNTVSALYPFGDPHRDYNPQKLKPGVWNVMPVLAWDHFRYVKSSDDVCAFYLDLMHILEQLPDSAL